MLFRSLDDGADPSALTRDYQLEAHVQGGAPLLSVWGGKITTFRRLAQEAADEVGHLLGDARRPWTDAAPLPGGDLSDHLTPSRRPDLDFQEFVRTVQQRNSSLPAPMLRRMARAYGSRIERILRRPLGREVAPGLYEAELNYLQEEEWARNAEDVLWRRSKLGLHYDDAQRQRVADWMTAHAPRAREHACS